MAVSVRVVADWESLEKAALPNSSAKMVVMGDSGGPPGRRWEKAVSWWQTDTVNPFKPEKFFLHVLLQTFWTLRGRNMTPAELMDVVKNPHVFPDWLERALPTDTLNLIRGTNAYGVFIEILQGVTPTGRHSDPLDFVADALGVALAAGLYLGGRRLVRA